MVWASGGGTIKISLAIGFPWRNAELMSILFKSHCLLDTMASVIRKHSLLPVGESDCIDDFSWKPLIKYLVFSCVILLPILQVHTHLPGRRICPTSSISV